MLSTKRTKSSQSTTPSTTSTSSPPSYSAEKVADNDDLLNEILLRLPIKSLMKFKSVSKHWLSLISNPNFSRHRTPLPASASGLLLHRRTGSGRPRPEFDYIDLNHNSNPAHPPFRSLAFADVAPGILQSCNGLLLCCARQASRPTKNYYVYNPTTRHYTVLPPLLSPSGTLTAICGVNLAFDPSKSPHYKVICVRKSDARRSHARRGQYQVQIYSSETGPWRISSLGTFAADLATQFNDAVFWNGAVHWFSPPPSGTSLYFKVDEERLGEMPMLPPVPDGFEAYNRMFSYFGESRDHMHFVDHIHERGDVRLNVYEMERDYSRWFVKYRVDLSQVTTAFPEIIPSSLVHRLASQRYDLFAALCVVRGELDEDSRLVFGVPGKVLGYNFESKTLYNLCDIEPQGTDEISEIWSLVDYVYQYIESLACV